MKWPIIVWKKVINPSEHYSRSVLYVKYESKKKRRFLTKRLGLIICAEQTNGSGLLLRLAESTCGLLLRLAKGTCCRCCSCTESRCGRTKKSTCCSRLSCCSKTGRFEGRLLLLCTWKNWTKKKIYIIFAYSNFYFCWLKISFLMTMDFIAYLQYLTLTSVFCIFCPLHPTLSINGGGFVKMNKKSSSNLQTIGVTYLIN